MNNPEQILEQIAVITWDTIGLAHFDRISFGEDAITSLSLLTLKNVHISNIAVVDTRVQESTKGCDFEFWIGRRKSGWYRYAIQAKKISVSNKRYNSIAHKVNGIPQIDILDSYAKCNRAIPLYCFYNHSKLVSVQKLNCSKYSHIKELGCSVTPLATVRTALNTRGARTFKWFHDRPETLPWSCLVRCPQISMHWPQSGYHHEQLLYEKLPDQLMHLLDGEFKGEQLIETDLFSKEVIYRPRWIGVLDISNIESNG